MLYVFREANPRWLGLAAHSASTEYEFLMERVSRKVSDGGCHDLTDAEWIVIKWQLRGHNDTPFLEFSVIFRHGLPDRGTRLMLLDWAANDAGFS
jgi:hypothetical protein